MPKINSAKVEKQIEKLLREDLGALGDQTPHGLASRSRQAIITKYQRDGRVQAKAEAGKVTVSWDDALGPQENHARAALALFHELGWNKFGDLAMGGTADGYVFVQVPKSK